MMFSVTYDTKVFQDRLAQIEINIRNLPGALHNALQGQQGKLANDALRKLTLVPGRPVYPIRWKSLRQRRAYFASGGFGRGIPTRRTYKLLQGWKVVYQQTATGGMVTLSNPIPYMRFVQGDEAQPFHLDTGWVQRADVIDDFLKEAGDAVAAAWWSVSRAAVEVRKR